MKSKTVKHKLIKVVKSFDQFGYPVSFKYKNDHAYKSLFGAIITIIIQLGLGIYFLILLKETLNYDNYQVRNSIHKKNLAFDDSKIILTKDNFDISIYLYLVDNNTKQEDTDLYFSFYFQQISLLQGLSEEEALKAGISFIWNATNLEYEICKKGRFGGDDATAEELQITNRQYCLKDDFNITLEGSYNSRFAKLFQVSIDYCNQDTLDLKYPKQNKTCKNKTEIDNLMSKMQIYIPLMSQYFDQKEFNNNPIKNLLNYDIFNTANKYLSNNKVIKTSQNYAIMKDSYISNSISSSQNLSYIDFRFYHDYIGPQDSKMGLSLLSFQFVQDEQFYIIERQVGTLFDAMSQVGGLMGFAFFIARVLTKWVQNALFYQSIIQRLFYQINYSILNDQSTITQQANQSQKLEFLNSSNFTTTTKMSKAKDISFDNIASDWANMGNQERSETALSFNTKKPGEILAYIKSLNAFVYRLRDFIKIRCARSSKYNLHDRLYQIGVDHLEHEFDILHILRQLRKIDIISKLLLSKHQIKLLKFANKNVLNTHLNQQQSINEKYKHKTVHFEEIKQSVNMICEKQATSKIDKKLIKLLLYTENNDKEQEQDHKINSEGMKHKTKIFALQSTINP